MTDVVILIISLVVSLVVLVIALCDIIYLNHKVKVLRMGVRLSSKALELIEQTGVDVNSQIKNAINLIRLEKDNGKRD